MTRLLIALAALLIFGAQLTAPVEAQGWTCTYDFSAGAQGWGAAPGSYGSGAFQTADVFAYGSYYWRAVYAVSPSFTSTTVTSVAAHFTLSEGSYASGGPGKIEIVKPGIAQLQSVDWNGTTPSSPFTWTGSTAATQIRVGVVASSATSATYSGSATITKIVITGTGTQPSNCPQDATPTPTTAPPTATGTPAPPTATPEVWVVNTFLTPTPIAIDASGLYEALQRGNDNLLGLPPDLNTSSLPQEDGRQVFAYVKWLISPSSADEIAGPFAPIISHTGIFLSLTFFLAVVYAVVWVSVFLFKFVVWIFKLILLIVDLVLQVAQAVGQFIGGIVKFLLGG